MGDEAKRCTATRKDGTPCKNWALADTGLCFFHGGRRALGPRQEKWHAPVGAEEDAQTPPASPPDVHSNGAKVPAGNVRAHLKHAADERSGEVVDVLFDAMKADREVWVTCKGCQKRTAVKVPDSRARVDAASKLVELGYGKVQEQKTKEIDPDTVDPLDIESMSTEEREALHRALLAKPEHVAWARRLRELIRDPQIREELRAELEDVEAFLPLLKRLPPQKGTPNLYWLKHDLAKFAQGLDEVEGRDAQRHSEAVWKGD